MSVVIFILILLALVLVHEFGHFAVAKAFKIRVDEFAFGFPPRLASFVRGGTRYAFNLFPIGGYVKIFGEDPAEVAAEDPDRARSFSAKSKPVQAAVILSGVAMNLVFAYVLVVATLLIGVGVSAYDLPEGEVPPDAKLLVMEVMEGSPAEAAGLRAGDRVLDIRQGEDALETKELVRPGGFSSFVSSHPTSELTVRYMRSDETAFATVTPAYGLNPKSTSTAAIGVLLDIQGTKRYALLPALTEGVTRTWEYTRETAVGIGDFFLSIARGTADLTQVTGPVGIVKVVGEASSLGIVPVLLLSALISINLAIINALPFPALDGGRFLFILIESVTRRSIPARVQARLNAAGLAFLLLLMVVITYHDIVKS